MKKIFLMAIMAVFTMSASAQLITSSRVAVNNNHIPSIWLDLGAGGFTGDVDGTGLGVDLGLRWTKMFGENVGWDILKVSAQTDTKHFSESLNVQGKTGLRYVSPDISGDLKIYANAALGYGFFTDNTDAHGLAYEFGAGLMITKNISVGLAYNNQHYSYEDYYGDDHGVNVGLISLRLGIGL